MDDGDLTLGLDLPDPEDGADGWTPPPPAFQDGKLRFLEAGGIYGIWIYVSMFGARASHDYESAREAQKVYNFKKYGRNASTVKAALEWLAGELGCAAIVACPGHEPGETALQRLFGTTLARTRAVASRKYDHKAEINFEFERQSLEIPDDFYESVKGRKVLVVDDVTTTGKTMRFYRLLFESIGVEAELAAVGIMKSMRPERTGPEWTMPEKDAPKSTAERVADYVARHNEIGELPPVEDPARRAACEADAALWLRTYFPDTFSRPFCDAHLEYMADLDDILRHGGQKAVALPRAFGKTSLTAALALRIILLGLRRFLMVVSATDAAAARIAKDILDMIQSERLARDYPEYCRPFIAIEGRAQRCPAQTWRGKPTGIQATADMIQLPRMGGAADGAIVMTRGITGAIRGAHVETGGEWLRPDFALLDDVQTRESAKSEAQTSARESTVTADILGLAGHDRDIAAVMCCTVIEQNDLSDRFLDPEKHPEWRGVRIGIVDGFGGKSEKDLWDAYDEAWRLEASGRAPRGTATAKYLEVRERIVSVCHAADPNLYSDGEADAVQHARNLYLKSGASFYAEYMNRPFDARPEALYSFRADDVLKRANGRARREVPDDAVAVLCAADVNRYAMAYATAAVDSAGTVSVLDYGWWLPDGRKEIFGDDGDRQESIKAAVADFVEARIRDGELGERIEIIAIDAGFEQQAVTEAAEAARRRWRKQVRIYAAKGFAADKYAAPRNKRAVFALGDGCDIRRVFPGGLLFAWDSHLHHMRAQRGFLYAPGRAGSISVFGDPLQAEAHRPFAEQLAADELVSTKLCDNGRTFAAFETHGRRNEMSDCMAQICALSALQSIVRFRADPQPEGSAEAAPTEDGPAEGAAVPAKEPAAGKAQAKERRMDRRRASFVTDW